MVPLFLHVIERVCLMVADGSFHTTMVLTQLFQSNFTSNNKRTVSIPLWFSRNPEVAVSNGTNFESFPYHYGSHATVMPKKLTIEEYVSIPLWFSRNEGRKDSRFQSPSFHTTMVLTQRIPVVRTTYGEVTFPYHYGSHATRGSGGTG